METIKALPDETVVFGGHDYLEENAAFALSVNPENEAIKERLELYEAEPLAAVFQTLGHEKKSNPFLQVKSPEEFAVLRAKKDVFG
ncbi:hypothetical protein EGM51_15090 [Verrucomicrobia bacterium S94]|nr:hypothetical protein EGM51_15090 [Verrucomicrobia bacterium S94]